MGPRCGNERLAQLGRYSHVNWNTGFLSLVFDAINVDLRPGHQMHVNPRGADIQH